MAGTVSRGTGVSPDLSGAILGYTDVERAAWPSFVPYVSTKRALWIEAGQPRFYRKGGPTDPPSGYKLLDRCGGRIFSPEPVRNRHPFILTDGLTGRPVWTFGAGGVTPNNLDTDFSGVLACASTLDASGTETNNLPLFAPTTGYSIAFKTRVPVVGSTVNGLTFSAAGGSVLGGGRTDTATGAFSAQIDAGAGYLRVHNQFGTATANQYGFRDIDFRDGAWHTFIVNFNQSAGTIRVFVDGVETPTISGCTTDILTASTLR